jgi:hypothetical protein
MRVATTLGTSPCSAIAQSTASASAFCGGEGIVPVTSSQK